MKQQGKKLLKIKQKMTGFTVYNMELDGEHEVTSH